MTHLVSYDLVHTPTRIIISFDNFGGKFKFIVLQVLSALAGNSNFDFMV